MTTSVFYGSAARCVDISGQFVGGSVTTPAQVYANVDALIDTKVTQTQSAIGAASTTNPTATFGATPANGSALIAVLCRTADNVTSTLSGWTQLTAGGSAGSRRVEIWWRRAGASEPTTVTFTNATAAGWAVALYEFGGYAAAINPVVNTAAVAGTSAASTGFDAFGTLTTVAAVVTGGATTNMAVSALTGSFATSSLTTSGSAYGIACCNGWSNSEIPQPAGQFTWTTNRAHTRASVGWPAIANSYPVAAGGIRLTAGTAISSTARGTAAMFALTFDTSAITSANTVTAATLSMMADTGVTKYPLTTGVSAFSLGTTAPTTSASNTQTVWKKPTQLSALTRVATRAANLAWVASTTYDWTSDSTFPAAVNKTGSTYILVATEYQKAGTTTANDEFMTAPTAASNHSLTVVHNLQATATVTATVATSPAITDIASFFRTITATVATSPVITRVVTFGQNITATVDASPIVARTATFARSIAATVDASPVITRAATFARTVTATVGNTITATGAIVITQAVRVLSLFMRNTVKIPQAVTVRLFGRSTIRIPKE